MMEKKQAQNLSGLVSVKGDAKPLENIPVRTSETPVIKEVAESINDTPCTGQAAQDTFI